MYDMQINANTIQKPKIRGQAGGLKPVLPLVEQEEQRSNSALTPPQNKNTSAINLFGISAAVSSEIPTQKRGGTQNTANPT